MLLLIYKSRERHPIFEPNFTGVQLNKLRMISQGGGGIVTDGGLNALPLVLLVEVWTSSPGACSYKYFADHL